MTLTITRLSPDDATAIDQWCHATEQVRRHEVPHFPPMPPRLVRLLLTHEYPGRRNLFHVALRDGEPVGRVDISLPTEENLRNLSFTIEVDPRFRRQGIGRQLLDFVLSVAADNGRTVLMSHSSLSLPDLPAHDGAGAAFGAAMGFGSTLPEVQRRLELASLDEAVLAGLYAHAQAKAEGYRLVHWREDTPDDLVAGVAYLDSRLISDAPMGDLQLEPEQIDTARMRQSEQVDRARGRQAWRVGAVHEATGQLAAFTAITTIEDVPWHAWQQITIVDPDHRGHRLGTLVKLENLRRFRAEAPLVEVIDTFNAAENSYMIAINDEMGYRPVHGAQNWQREL
ncbi:GNAT family N-acetyltransferase [Catellatospora sp. TT07R-123]|uniref:GNAT family N-acetyltransferase n=1 Tax=Catellatospora sp. TT07R-123 TaxID=2733863 RepID=UPI001B0CE827|nr:GNAT family N-acetyltransferase [Catellatospora sp. TT07R-123]GHJ46356.1 GNAT family N-acetyltransferase [Catellatospora sp. TT07R-123]